MSRPIGRLGFTLVELLIVVAIIGVLATIGVPTYRKMIQKARKAEAQQLLGDIYKVEAAFRGEYDAYTNHLEAAGFSIEPSPGLPEGAYEGRYTVGFPATVCNDGLTVAYPTTGPAKVRIQKALPHVYTGLGSIWMPRENWLAGQGTTTPCLASTISNDGSSYTATATGVLHQGDFLTTPLADRDQWTINDQRTLSNVLDGIR